MEKSDQNDVCLDVNDRHGGKTLSSNNVSNSPGDRAFSATGSESTDLKKTTVIHLARKKQLHRDRLKREVKLLEKSSPPSGKADKKSLQQIKVKESRKKNGKPIDRDLRRFKAKYNSSIGNIVREWMGLIYCILILRMNLIKFILKHFPDQSEADIHLHKQILLESKIMFNMIRDAQNSSQEKFVLLWTHLEKLIFNRKLLKHGLQVLQIKESGLRDWKTAELRLSELQNEYDKTNEEYKEIQQSKLDAEMSAKETMAQLEKLVDSKDAEYNNLVEKIGELKKREVQMRGRILINMKSYKDLKAKKQKLVSLEEKMKKLKNDQVLLTGEYTSRIQSLKQEIEENEKLIMEAKDEKKKIRARLEGFGDYPGKQEASDEP